MARWVFRVLFLGLLLLGLVGWSMGCAGGPLTSREKGGIFGGRLGATACGIIGNQSGHPGAGAAIGGALGLGAGALIGDQLQEQDLENRKRQEEIDRLQREIERQQRELERLKR